MRIACALSLLMALCLCGCARSYVITLHNGTRLTAASKPRLKEGYYVFKDARGNPASVSAGRVREVAPAGMASEVNTSPFKTVPGR